MARHSSPHRPTRRLCRRVLRRSPRLVLRCISRRLFGRPANHLAQAASALGEVIRLHRRLFPPPAKNQFRFDPRPPNPEALAALDRIYGSEYDSIPP